jgi:hypothetical protein
MHGRHLPALEGIELHEFWQYETHRDTAGAGRQVGEQMTSPLTDV